MKITKKAINEAPKYIIMLDPLACGANNTDGFYRFGFDLYFKTLTANTVIEAMAEAERYFNETTLAITIAEKTGEINSDTEGIVYKDILTTRGGKLWQICDDEHFELPYYTSYNLQYKSFELIGKVEE